MKDTPPDKLYWKTPLWKGEDGSYYDEKGTLYPDLLFDENRPGLDSLWALSTKNAYTYVSSRHDPKFDRAKLGYPLSGENAVSVSTDLIKDAAHVAFYAGLKPVLAGLSNLALFPIITALGVGIGLPRYLWLQWKSGK